MAFVWAGDRTSILKERAGVVTHWSALWQDGEEAIHERFRAVCGKFAPEREFSNQPSCPRCAEIYAEYERREPWGPK